MADIIRTDDIKTKDGKVSLSVNFFLMYMKVLDNENEKNAKIMFTKKTAMKYDPVNSGPNTLEIII